MSSSEAFVDEAAWELEEPEQFDWDPGSSGIASSVDGDEGDEDEGVPADSAVDAAAAVAEEEPEEPAAPATPARVGTTVASEDIDDVDGPPTPEEDAFESSWTLGDAPASELPAEPEAAGYGVVPTFDSASEAGSEVSWACSDATPVLRPSAAPVHVASTSTAAAEAAFVAEAVAAAPVAEAPSIDMPLAAAGEELIRGAAQSVSDDDAAVEDTASEASFHVVPGPHDRFVVETADVSSGARLAARPPPARPKASSNRMKRIDLPTHAEAAKYGAAALTDERSHPYLNELPTLRAQLRSIGPLGEQLYALASRQAATARRTAKHTPQAQRHVVGEAEWWNCLLESLGLPATPPVGPGTRALGGGAGSAPH